MSAVQNRGGQSVAAPRRLGREDATWFWVEPKGSKPGYWTDDHLEAQHRREAGRVVLQAVDGQIEGVEGCAHRADVMRLSARVWGLELTLGALLDELGRLGDLADLATDLPGSPDEENPR